MARLGDESKVVRRAAADAARQLGDRLWAGLDDALTPDRQSFRIALASALGYPDDRTRRGATRVFAAHFRDLSRDTTLAGVLIARLDDTRPGRPDAGDQGALAVLVLAVRHGAPQQDRGRLHRPPRPPRAPVGPPQPDRGPLHHRRREHPVSLQQLAPLARRRRHAAAAPPPPSTRRSIAWPTSTSVALEGDNPLRREGVLRALSEFHERPEGTGRIGNDIEPILFYEEALPKLSAALLEDPRLAPTRRPAASASRRWPPSAATATPRSPAPWPSAGATPTRTSASGPATMAKEFPLDVKPGKAEPALIALIDGLLASPIPEARARRSPSSAGSGRSKDASLDRGEAVVDHLKDTAPEARAAAIRRPGVVPEAARRGRRSARPSATR